MTAYYRPAYAVAVAMTYVLALLAVLAVGATIADPHELDRVHACTIPAAPGSACHELDARLAAMHAARPGTIREGGR